MMFHVFSSLIRRDTPFSYLGLFEKKAYGYFVTVIAVLFCFGLSLLVSPCFRPTGLRMRTLSHNKAFPKRFFVLLLFYAW